MVSQQDIYAAWNRFQEARDAAAEVGNRLSEATARVQDIERQQKEAADRVRQVEGVLLQLLKRVDDSPKAVYQILGNTILRDGDRMETLPSTTVVM